MLPLENFPNRTPLDACEYIKKYTTDKIVCDLGCGAGDLLEYLKTNNYCNAVYGIENNKSRYNKAFKHSRNYIIYGDMFKVDIPDADVYLSWLTFDISKVLNEIKNKQNAIFIVFGDHTHQNRFENEHFDLIEMIWYQYDETEWLDEGLFDYTLRFDKTSNKILHINNHSWDILGVRQIGVYKFKSGPQI